MVVMVSPLDSGKLADERSYLNHMSKILEIVAQSSLKDREIWIDEAKFGFRYIQSFCEDLGAGASVLEVGCGSGILLGMLSEIKSSLEFEGIEPFGDGFKVLKELNALLQERGMVIHNVGFENYEPNRKYDLIYLVNVFEHLADWRQFLKFVERHLADNGVCVILCPNYNVPYESHVRIPILFNKRITEKVFKKAIVSYETEYNFSGLWNSLNFVKLSEVKSQVKASRLSLAVNHKITDDLIERMSVDEDFKKRQRIVGLIGSLMKRLRLTKLFRFGVFQNLQPYMMLELRLKEGG